jgi:hypothetical protein
LKVKGKAKPADQPRSWDVEEEGTENVAVGRKIRALRVDSAPLFRQYHPNPKYKTVSALSADSHHQRNCNQPPQPGFKVSRSPVPESSI